MVRAYCPVGRHYPEYVIVFPNEELVGRDAAEIGIVLDNLGKATNQWGDGVAGVPVKIRRIAEEEEAAYCVDCNEEIDWIHEKKKRR